MAHYAFLNNDHTTGTLREELSVLYTEMSTLTSIEEPTEEDTAAIEAKQVEIDAKQQEIDNALCVVTKVITGVLETYEVSASDETYYGKGQLCKRTSYNTIGGVHQNGGTPFRKNYAGVGYTYDPVRDAFYAPQPFASWTLNEDTCLWECPVEKPEGEYWWKEDTTEWVDYLYLSQPYNSEPPYPSWSWSTETGWTAPVEKVEGKDYWNEEAQQWTTTYLVGPKPYPSWIVKDVEVGLNKVLASVWSSPVEMPNDGNSYLWDEETQNWLLEK